MIYLYNCNKHGMFEVSKPMAKAPLPEACPECGQVAQRRYTGLPALFGFRLSDRTRERFGPKDEFVRDV